MRCAIYASRPNVCRIYPAEINPFTLPQPSDKACPAEAWSADGPPFLRAGMLVDEPTRAAIHRSRTANESDVGVKQRLCALLGIHAAAMSNEGFVAHAPGQEALSSALAQIMDDDIGAGAVSTYWLFVSDRPSTVEALVDIGASALSAEDGAPRSFDFVSSSQAR